MTQQPKHYDEGEYPGMSGSGRSQQPNDSETEQLVNAIWATVKQDSLASSRIGTPSQDTVKKLAAMVQDEILKARLDEQNWLHMNGVYTITDCSMLGGDREDYTITISKQKREARLAQLNQPNANKEME